MSLHQNMASMIGFMIVLVGTRHWWLHDCVIKKDSS
jgi:hypothetical protein